MCRAERHPHAHLLQGLWARRHTLRYAVAKAEVIRDFEKIRNHYGVSRMAQIAGLEALADQDICGQCGAVAAGVGASRQSPSRTI